MDKMLRMRKDPRDNVSEPTKKDGDDFYKGMVGSHPVLEKLGAMLGTNPSKGDPNMLNRKMGETIQIDHEPEMRSQEGDNSDMMKYLPKKQPSIVPNSLQPSVPSQSEVYDAIDPSEEDPKMTARKRALMMLQGQ